MPLFHIHFYGASQEMRTAAIARPLEINQTEKALRAAIKETLVSNLRLLHSNSIGFHLKLLKYFKL